MKKISILLSFILLIFSMTAITSFAVEESVEQKEIVIDFENIDSFELNYNLKDEEHIIKFDGKNFTLDDNDKKFSLENIEEELIFQKLKQLTSFGNLKDVSEKNYKLNICSNNECFSFKQNITYDNLNMIKGIYKLVENKYEQITFIFKIIIYVGILLGLILFICLISMFLLDRKDKKAFDTIFNKFMETFANDVLINSKNINKIDFYMDNKMYKSISFDDNDIYLDVSKGYLNLIKDEENESEYLDNTYLKVIDKVVIYKKNAIKNEYNLNDFFEADRIEKENKKMKKVNKNVK